MSNTPLPALPLSALVRAGVFKATSAESRDAAGGRYWRSFGRCDQ